MSSLTGGLLERKIDMRKIFKKLRLRTLIALGIITLLLPIVIFTLYRPNTPEAAWFDESWLYRKRILVTNNTSQETNKYIAFDSTDVLDTSGAEFQTDCDDIRFTNGNGKILPHFINSGCDSASTDIDVFFDTFPAGAQYIYMYYGNANALSGQAPAAFASEATNYTLGTPASQEKGPSPVAHWKLDEGVDNTCSGGSNDTCNSVPQGFDGAFGASSAAPAWKADEFCISGKCLLFDGSDDVVSIGSTISGIRTVSFWVKIFSTSTTEQLIDLNATDYITSTNGTVTVNGFGTDTIYVDGNSGVTSLNANKWHYVTVTTTSDFSGSAIKIGQISTNYGNAFIDEVKIYNYARSAAQIKTDYLARATGGEGSGAVLGGVDSKAFLSDGLLGYWPSDDNVSGNAQTITDKSGVGNNGTTDDGANNTGMNCKYNGTSPAPIAGKFTGACELDGTDDFVNVGDIAAFDFDASTSFTISAWVYHDDAGASTERVVAKRNSGSNPQVGYYLSVDSSNQLQGVVDDGTNTVTSTAVSTLVTTATWKHVAMVVDRNNQLQTLYIDGQQVDQDSISTVGSMATNTQPFRIGAASNDGEVGPWDGKIDEVRLYKRALSPHEIQRLYSWAPGPNIYLPFDTNSGTSTAFDKSGNGKNGTMSGFAESSWVPGKFGAALDFDGSTSEIDVASPSLSATDYTYMAWIYPDAAGAANFLFNVHDGAGADELEIEYDSDSDTQVNSNGTGGVVNGTDTMPTGAWYHVAVTRSASTISLYVNGLLNATGTDGTAYTIGGGLGVGADAHGNSDYFDGKMDEVRVYNYARTSGQILEDMNAGHPIGGSPIGTETIYWKFDEQTGTTANDTIGNENGTVDSAASWLTKSSCKINGCLLFDASGEEVLVTDANDDDVNFNGSETFSASAWIYVTTMPGTTDEDAIIAKWDESAGVEKRAYRMYVTDADGDSLANLTAEMYDESANQAISASSTDEPIAANTWHHVSFTFNGGTTGAAGDLKTYVDGKFSAQNSANASFLGVEDVATDFTVAEYDPSDAVSGNTAFTGRIDEVKVYSSTLTTSEILLDFNANSAVNFSTKYIENSQLSDGAGSYPVGYWPMDNNTGTSVSDISGNNYTGTFEGTASMTNANWVPGKYGSAVDFDGVNDRVTTGDNIDFGASDDFTIAFWIRKQTATSTDAAIAKKSSTLATNAGYEIHISANTNQINFIAADGVEQFELDGVNLTANTWQHLAIVWDDDSTTNTDIYLDGVKQIAAQTGTQSSIDSITNTQTLTFGSESGSNDTNFLGQMDEIKIFNYALSPAQVSYEYNRGRPIAWFKLDECSGSTAYDASGRGNNGTISAGDTSGDNDTVGTCGSGTSTEMWNDGTTGKRNSSLDFDGTNDNIDMNDVNILDADSTGTASNPLTDFTISGWFNRDTATTTDTILAKRNGIANTDDGYIVYLDASTDQLIFEISDTADTDEYSMTSTSTFTSTGWNHFAVVWDDDSATNSKIYINGLDDNETHSGTIANIGQANNSVDFKIGDESDATTTTGQNPFDGRLDDIRVYSYALSETQVKKLMNEDSGTRFGPSEGSP